MSKKKKKNKVKSIPDGLYTIHWEEEFDYSDNGFWVPGTASTVRGYQFTGTKQEIAMHIAYYLKRKDNLIKVEVHPLHREKPNGYWHEIDGVRHECLPGKCPELKEEFADGKEEKEDNPEAVRELSGPAFSDNEGRR